MSLNKIMGRCEAMYDPASVGINLIPCKPSMSSEQFHVHCYPHVKI